MSRTPVNQPSFFDPIPVTWYWALCLREPYLALILAGKKTLESRTRLLRREGGPVVLTSATKVDEEAWTRLGYLLTAAQRDRAKAQLGGFRGMAVFGDARRGTYQDDDAVCAPADGKWLWSVSEVKEFEQSRKTVRVRPSGIVVDGSKQGFFKVPASALEGLT